MKSPVVRPGRPAPVMTGVLLAFFLALFTLHLPQPAHLHHGTTPGVYNEEHVLASLESAIGDVPLPDQAPPVVIAPATCRTAPAPVSRAVSTVAPYQDSRAPPLA
jgi:hypothetical protein